MNFVKELKKMAFSQTKPIQQMEKQRKQENMKDQNKKIEKEDSTAITKSINFFTEMKNKAVAQLTTKKQQNQANKVQNKNKKFSKTQKQLIWKTAVNIKSEQNNKIQSQQEQQSNDYQDAHFFIENLVKSIKDMQKAQKQKSNKARALIFQSINIQPIYLSQNCERRILQMQFELTIQQMKEKIIDLTQDNHSVNNVMKKIISTGYLWEANRLQYRSLIDSCAQIIFKEHQRVRTMYNLIVQERKIFKPIVINIKKMQQLQKSQKVMIKKIKLLNNLKKYLNDFKLEPTNIDQAYFIERNKQKMYHHFIRKGQIVQKVQILKILKRKIYLLNVKTIKIVLKELQKWINEKQQIENKHIEKTLILLFFIRTELMYKQSDLKINFTTLNTNKFAEEIEKVKKWESYRYVNDKGIQTNVKSFLTSLIYQLAPNRKKQMLTVISKEGNNG